LTWASEGQALAPPWILKFSAKKGGDFSFEWEKTNLTTFGPYLKKFAKVTQWPPPAKNHSDARAS